MTTITNSTLVGNTAGQGGGIFHSGGTVTLQNTIVADNLDNLAFANDLGGDFDPASSFNLIGIEGSFTGLSDGVLGNQVGVAASPIDPLLGPLQDNGGPTSTHAFLPGSPAIDAGDNGIAPSTDQRGEPRPIDGDGDGILIVDIGAFETSLLAPSDIHFVEESTRVIVPPEVIETVVIEITNTGPVSGTVVGLVGNSDSETPLVSIITAVPLTVPAGETVEIILDIDTVATAEGTYFVSLLLTSDGQPTEDFATVELVVTEELLVLQDYSQKQTASSDTE